MGPGYVSVDLRQPVFIVLGAGERTPAQVCGVERELPRHSFERIHRHEFGGIGKTFDCELALALENVVSQSRARVQGGARNGDKFGEKAPFDSQRIRQELRRQWIARGPAFVPISFDDTRQILVGRRRSRGPGGVRRSPAAAGGESQKGDSEGNSVRKSDHEPIISW